jgi:hypothetical protein
MTRQEFIEIGRCIHRLSLIEIGRTALNSEITNMAHEIADICANDRHFNRAAFFDACGLASHNHEGD